MSENTLKTIAPPEKKDLKPIREIERLGDLLTNVEFQRKLSQAVPATITVQRVISTLAGSIRKSPDLMKCNIMDVAGKILMVANTGLELDSALQHAHLIPYKENKWNPATRKREPVFIAQVVFGYRGLLDLSYRSGQVGAVRAECVWKDECDAGLFQHEYGTTQFIKHIKGGKEHNTSAIAQAAGTAEFPVWAYAYAQLTDGRGVPFEVLPWTDVRRIRDNSPAYRSALYFMEQSKQDGKPLPAGWSKAPWVEHVVAMANKTAFRRLSNWLPRTVEFAAALALDEASERGSMDLGPIVDLNTSHYAEAALDAAGMSDDAGAAFGIRDHDDDGVVIDVKPKAAPVADKPAKLDKPAKPAKVANPEPEDDGPPAGWDDDAPPISPGSSPVSLPNISRAAPAFDVFLLDENGEPARDAPFSDPLLFAQELYREWDKSGNRIGLIEQNADGIADARTTGNPNVADMLDQMTGPDDQAETPVILLTMDRGKPNVAVYLKEWHAAVADLTPGNFVDFTAANMPVLMAVPPAARMQAVKALVTRADALGVPRPQFPTGAPEPSQDAPQGEGEPKEDPDWTTARNRASEMADCKDIHDLEAMARGVLMNTFGDRLNREGKHEIKSWLEGEYVKAKGNFR